VCILGDEGGRGGGQKTALRFCTQFVLEDLQYARDSNLYINFFTITLWGGGERGRHLHETLISASLLFTPPYYFGRGGGRLQSPAASNLLPTPLHIY